MPDETKIARDKFIAELLADPEAFKREVDAKVRAEHPDITDERLEAQWGLVKATFGI